MNLLVDIGNSRMKWALAESGGQFLARGVLREAIDAAALTTCWREIAVPAQVAVSNVKGEVARAAVDDWCRQNWQQAPWFLQATANTLGIQNSYTQPDQLGSDRLAALLGARALTAGDLVVIDCGTALTIDLLDRDDRFRGGIIFPGPGLAVRALHLNTQEISTQLPELPNPTSVLGTSTESCIAGGVQFGVAGAIDRILDEMLATLDGAGSGPLPVYLTGGGGERIQPFIKHNVVHEPDLVLRGLSEALKRKC